MSKSEKRKMGRLPAEGRDEPLGESLHIRLPPEMVRKIDAICRSRLDRPNQSAVVRELIAKGLGA